MMRHLDPRGRLLLVLLAAAMIASNPPAALERCWFYAAILLPVSLRGGASLRQTLRRSLAALPFLALASGSILLRDGMEPAAWRAAASVLCNGMLIAWLLAALAATTAMTEVIGALQQLRAPAAFTQVLALMIRYGSLFQDEHRRMDRARESRTTRPLGSLRWRIYSRQFGTLILRAFDRATRIHTAMAARGFAGTWPLRELPAFSARQALMLSIGLSAFGAVRFWP